MVLLKEKDWTFKEAEQVKVLDNPNQFSVILRIGPILMA